ncbi:uncharacterized protein VICG_01203 [Vittaforma corneae ATCC 50505]|uniref:Uncharacterized protein n=1 Tax=Vittaforma corneae (strain ATCC 50505) TaxID=993615 RepID=L2GM47_VITCO|nr:uncharacterized protein VICG_01203 [Vittaforma corneae ATCC 50505]ELA41699.1 hypothetical protein VICG_01203 [Vittaforma corneae ATCC 50505]
MISLCVVVLIIISCFIIQAILLRSLDTLVELSPSLIINLEYQPRKTGEVGFLFKESMFEIENLGASLHRRFTTYQFFGHGLSGVFLYDVNQRQKIWSTGDVSLSLDVKEHVLVHSSEKHLKMTDVRSNDTMKIPLNVNITDLSFSGSGDMLLVCTDQFPLIVDLRHI